MKEIQAISLSDAPRVPFKFDGRILHTSGRYELVHLTLQPGEEMEMHTQPMDVVFFVAEGSGTLRAGGEIMQIEENTAVSVAKRVMRAWSNEGVGPVRILVNKILE